MLNAINFEFCHARTLSLKLILPTFYAYPRYIAIAQELLLLGGPRYSRLADFSCKNVHRRSNTSSGKMKGIYEPESTTTTSNTI
jgi:hypothetical protein